MHTVYNFTDNIPHKNWGSYILYLWGTYGVFPVQIAHFKEICLNLESMVNNNCHNSV